MKDIRGRRHAQKGKAPAAAAREPGMSAEMVAHWRRGDDNMESSTKMVALVEALREGDASGDKTIVFSQCAYQSPSSVSVGAGGLMACRDVDARLDRDALCAVRDPQPAV